MERSTTSELGHTGGNEALDMRCEHVNADCMEFVKNHKVSTASLLCPSSHVQLILLDTWSCVLQSFNRCLKFAENIKPLKHVQARTDEMFGVHSECKNDAPDFVKNSIQTLSDHYSKTLSTDPKQASAECRTNPFEARNVSSEGPNLRRVRTWLRGVYDGKVRPWAPGGKVRAAVQWSQYVDQHLAHGY